MKKLKTVKEMIVALGSTDYVALSLRVSRRTLFYWMSSNQVGRESRLDLLNMLKVAGYTAMTLKDINDLKPVKQVAKC